MQPGGDLERVRADRDHVRVAERPVTHDTLAVDQRAGGGAEVHDVVTPAVLLPLDARVTPARRRIGDPDRATGITPDLERRPIERHQGQRTLRRSYFNAHQYLLHRPRSCT